MSEKINSTKDNDGKGVKRIHPESEETQNADTQNAQPETEAPPQLSEKEQLEENLAKVKNEYLYLRAEFDNYKKQMIKERSDYLKFGSERLVTDLLNVLDNFNLALNVDMSNPANNPLDTFKKGMELTATEFLATLKRFGVSEAPAEGKPFDPNYHEALSSEETDQIEPGHVYKVFKAGYKLHDRLIRPAQVVVAKAKTT